MQQGHHTLEQRNNTLRQMLKNKEMLIDQQSCIIEELFKTNQRLQLGLPRRFHAYEE
jgi:hypothetical protein